MKKGISIGIIALFIISAVSPMVIGFKSDAIADVGIAEEIEPESTELSGPMDSAWPMFCHDVKHTGRSPYGATGGAGVEKWKFRMEGMVTSSPAIDKNGTIYIGSTSDYCLFAVYSNGTEKWQFKTTDWMQSSPAIAADGTIYIGTDDGYLLAIYPNGTEKWRFKAGGNADWVHSSPVISNDGTIYFGVVGPGWYKGRIYAVYPNGTEKWHYDTFLDLLLSLSRRRWHHLHRLQ